MAAPGHGQSRSGIAEALEATTNPDNAMREAGEGHLRALHDGAGTVADYLVELSELLATEGGKEVVRHQAGMLLKNFLHAEDTGLRAEKEKRWHGLAGEVKERVKYASLASLHSADKGARDTGAQLVSKIAHAEQPNRLWPEMVKTMLESMMHPNAGEHLREATLKALGYVCLEVNDLGENAMSHDEVNQVLTAIVHGMRAEEPSVLVRLTATMALGEALPFAEHNFKADLERKMIMDMIFQACECPGEGETEAQVRRKAFQCLFVVADKFYTFLPNHIQQAFTVIQGAIEAAVKAGPDVCGEVGEYVAMNAIEFWTVVAEIEHELAEYASAEEPNYEFARKAAPALLPILLPALAVQPERDEFDDSDHNLSQASSRCLESLTMAVGAEILPHVMPFVGAGIVDMSSWQQRESSVRLFGCLIEALPGNPALVPFISDGLVHLCRCTEDSSLAVVISALWCLGRLGRCQANALAGSSPEYIENVIKAVLAKVIPTSKAVLLRACDALAMLCEGLGEAKPAVLGPSLPVITQMLTNVLVSLHSSADPSDLQVLVVAHHAVQAAIGSCGPENQQLPLVQHLMTQLVSLLGSNTASQFGRASFDNVNEEECCGTLQAALQRVRICSNEDSSWSEALGMVAPDVIMQGVNRLLQAPRADGRVDEAAMRLAGSLADLMGEDFMRYLEGKDMPSLMIFVQQGLSNHVDQAGFSATIGVVSDLCRALGSGIGPYAKILMDLMYQALRSEQLHRACKPLIFGCIGDMASALERNFAPYAEEALRYCYNASMHVLNKLRGDLSPENGEWFNSLRKSILDAYSAMLSGMQPEPGQMPLLNTEFYVDTPSADGQRQLPVHPGKHMLAFIGHMYKRGDELAELSSQDFDKACYSVLGLIVLTLGRYISDQLRADAQWIMDLINKGQVKYANDPEMQEELAILRQALGLP